MDLTFKSGVLGGNIRTSKGVGHPGEENHVRLQICHTLPGLDHENKFNIFLISALRGSKKKGNKVVLFSSQKPGGENR